MNYTVSSLFKDGWWDIDKLSGVLSDDIVQKIISSPVFKSHMQDSQIWSFSSNGLFSVKSAFIIFLSLLSLA